MRCCLHRDANLRFGKAVSRGGDKIVRQGAANWPHSNDIQAGVLS